ncbi:hypothetical protein [Geobacillus sp. YF-1]|uniref:hypothetical protein n=1 Tax=Geobacillus sp. YF-1 TaxID=3457480 RepID=UPI0040459DAA
MFRQKWVFVAHGDEENISKQKSSAQDRASFAAHGNKKDGPSTGPPLRLQRNFRENAELAWDFHPWVEGRSRCP